MVEKYLIKGSDTALYKVSVEEDHYAMSPFDLNDYGDTVVTINTRECNYTNTPGVNSFEDVAGEFAHFLEDDDDEIDSLNRLMSVAEKNGYWLFPVWGYSHGCLVLCLTTGENPFGQWDSGVAGVIYAKADDLLESSKEYAFEYFNSIVETLNKYNNGYVYSISVEDVTNHLSDNLGSVYFKMDFPTKEEILEYVADMMGFDAKGSQIVDECDEEELLSKRQIAHMHLAEAIRKYKDGGEYSHLSANLQITLDQVLAEASRGEIM